MGTPIDLVPDSKYCIGGHKVVWSFITILYLCHALLLNLRLCEEHLYCLGKRSVFAVSTSPRVSGSPSFTATNANPGSVPEPANFVAGSLVGWPLVLALGL